MLDGRRQRFPREQLFHLSPVQRLMFEEGLGHPVQGVFPLRYNGFRALPAGIQDTLHVLVDLHGRPVAVIPFSGEFPAQEYFPFRVARGPSSPIPQPQTM